MGGKGEIRTPEELAPLPLFESGAFNHSATFPMPTTLPFFRIFANFWKNGSILGFVMALSSNG
jgi:hypothetical protein